VGQLTRRWPLLTICLTHYGEKDGVKNSRVFYKLLNGESNVKMSAKDDTNLRKLRKKFSKIDLVVIKRSGSSENLGSSRPCCDCLKVLKILHLNVVYYSTASGEIEHEKIRDMTSTHMAQSAVFMRENKVWK
jgi:hypothetical protein